MKVFFTFVSVSFFVFIWRVYFKFLFSLNIQIQNEKASVFKRWPIGFERNNKLYIKYFVLFFVKHSLDEKLKRYPIFEDFLDYLQLERLP